MSSNTDMRAYLIFTGSGPILVLSTYPDLTDPGLVEKLRFKGIGKFIAYQVDLPAVEERYPESYASATALATSSGSGGRPGAGG